MKNINWLHFTLLHVRDAATPARGRRSVTTGGFFGIGGTTYKVYEGTKVESDDLVRVPDLRLLPRKFGSGAAAGGPEEVSVTGR